MTKELQTTAIPFVYLEKDHFVVSDQAKQFLSQINKPIAVLTIVGKYRTGKSLFLNRIMLGKSKAFRVSPTINSCTRGLWLWKDTIKFKNQEEQKQILIIDTEGFGATQESDSYNNKILLFALLLSSYFVYNSVGSIDQNSLNNISVLANLANQIQSKNSKDQNIDQNFPSFLWLVRDFTLNLVDKNDIPIQAKQYLEQALQIQKGTSNNIEGKNRIRRMMKHFFKDRDCFTLVRPVQTEEKLQQLDTLEEQGFRPTFLEQSKILRQKILAKIKPKKIKQTLLTGQTFFQLAKNYVEVVNNNSLPNFQNSYKHLLKLEMKNLKRSICHNQEGMRKKILHSSLKSIKSVEDFQDMKKAHILLIQSQVKQKITAHHSLSAFVNSEQITALVNEIKNFTQKNLEQSLRAIKEEIKFKYVTKMDSIREDNLLSDPLEKIFTEREMKEFLNDLQRKLSEQLINSQIPDFMINELGKEFFVPFKQSLMNKFNELKARRLNESINELNLKLQLREQHIRNKEQQMIRLNKQLKENRKYVSELEVKLALTQKELTVNKEISNKSIEELKQRIKKLTDENINIGNDSIQTKRQLEIKSQQIEKLKKTIEGQTNEGKFIQKELFVCQQRFQTQIKQITIKSALIEDISHKNEAFCVEIRELKQKLDEVRQSKQDLYERFLQNSKQLTEKSYSVQTINLKQSTELHMLRQNIEKLQSSHHQQISYLKQLISKQQTLNKQLSQQNLSMNETIISLQQTVSHFYLKENSYKQFKKCFKNSSSIQCQHCSRFFMSSIFLTHLSVCTAFNQNQLTSQSLSNQSSESIIHFKINKVSVQQNGIKPLTTYQLQCKIGQDKFIIHKTFNDFCSLHQNLQNSLPGLQLSSAKSIFDPKYLSKKSFSIQEKQVLIQQYFNDLGLNPLIHSNPFWIEFISFKVSKIEPEISKRSALNEINQFSVLNYQMRKSRAVDQNTKLAKSQRKQNVHTPEQFFKIWQQKQMRSKASSISLKQKSFNL